MNINSILEKRNKFQVSDEASSSFDFKMYEIEDEHIKVELIRREAIARNNIMQISRNTLELGKVLYEAQELLANNKNGAFNGWFLNLGLKKDYVYREIQRYRIFLKYHNEKIRELPVRALKYISNPEVPEENIIEIIEADEPSKKISEIEKQKKIEAAPEEKIIELEYRILQAKKNIEKWEKEIRELRKK